MWIRPANVPAYTDDELGTFNDLNGFNGTDSIADPMDDNGHGTHCAGHNRCRGRQWRGYRRRQLARQDHAAQVPGPRRFRLDRRRDRGDQLRHRPQKTWRKHSHYQCQLGLDHKSKALEDTIRAAGDAGILFVAAAGNDGSNNDSRPHYPSNYDLPNVISVAALDRNDQLWPDSQISASKQLHVAAPGKDILSTWLNDAYREASGTSMATPYVSGVAALIIANEPNISMEKLQGRILKSVDKLDSLNGKVATGGRINAAKALGN